MEFQNIYGIWGLSAKPQEWLLAFSGTFRREMPFENKIYLSKQPGSCSFRIYMVIGVYLQNLRSYCQLLPAPSGMRRPLEMKYIYSSTLGHAVSEYIWLWGLSAKPQVIAWFFLDLQEGDGPLSKLIFSSIYDSVHNFNP